MQYLQSGTNIKTKITKTKAQNYQHYIQSISKTISNTVNITS